MDFFKASKFACTPRLKLERRNAHKTIEFDDSGSVGQRGSRSPDVSCDHDSSSVPRCAMDFFNASKFAGTPTAKLERRNAQKSIEFDVSGSVGRGSRSSDVSYDLDSSSLREDETPEAEFRVGSMRDVEDANNKLRKYGLYTNVGISNELWESQSPNPDVSPIEGASPHWMRQESFLFGGDDSEEPPPAASLSTSLGQLWPRASSTNAHKSIKFDVSGSVGRRGSRSSDVSYDLDETPEEEFRYASMRDVEDTNNKLRNYGLYTNVGISNELWESRRPNPDVSPIEGASAHWMRQDSLLFDGDDSQEPPPAASLSTSLGQLWPRASSARDLDVQRKAESAAQPVKKPAVEKKTSPLRHNASAKEPPTAKSLDMVHKVMAGKVPASQGHPYRTFPEAPSSSNTVPSKEQVQGPNNFTRPTRSQPLQPSGWLTLKRPPAMTVLVPCTTMSSDVEYLGSLAPDFDGHLIAQNWSDSDRQSESEDEVEDSPEVRTPVSEVEPQRGEQRNDVGHAGIASPHPGSNTFVIRDDHNGGTEQVKVMAGKAPTSEGHPYRTFNHGR